MVLVAGLASVFRTLNVLCFLHAGLHTAWALQERPAAPTPGPNPALNPVEAAIAEGKKQRDKGHFGESLKAFERASQAAHQMGNVDDEAKALVFLSGAQIRLFQYRPAVESAQQARQLASGTKDSFLAGLAAGNLSTIYTQLGDLSLAEREAADSVRLLEGSPRSDLAAKALINYASIQIAQKEITEAEKTSDRAIAVAQKAGLPALEAEAWDYRGTSLLLEGEIPQAETALRNALEIRLEIQDRDGLALSQEHQAELELRKPKPDYSAALNWINEAFASPSPSFKTSPQYYPIHIRAKILLGLRRSREALAEFHNAVEAANNWRAGALPGDVTSTRTTEHLHDVYHDYALLAAELSLQNHNAGLARQALEALAENRAASLRDQMTLALSRNFLLPHNYFELLSELQATQAKVTLGKSSPEDQAKLHEIRIKLGDLENTLGISIFNSPSSREKIPNKNSLRDVQGRLSGTEILLNFCLGKEKSFLWAVTRDDVNLYQLPPGSEIESQARKFSEQTQAGEPPFLTGRRLSESLFGKLRPEEWKKPEWLIVPDGALLGGIPFAALPSVVPSFGEDAALIAKRNLRFLPTENLLLMPDAAAPERRFLGVADPIYNIADARRATKLNLLEAKQSAESAPLARLVGSDREVRSAAKRCGLADSQILVGTEASVAGLGRALARTPEILHFAVHVASPPGQPQEAALVLSLSTGGLPELLTPEAVATYRVPGTLVVLSGCSSQQGKPLPSAGLMGLSRAWLLAGAAAVIVSAWPTPDDSGQFFSAFYSHFQSLQGGSVAHRASSALQAAQLDMVRSGGYRSSPSFWAAYSIVSKE